jgi:serine protease
MRDGRRRALAVIAAAAALLGATAGSAGATAFLPDDPGPGGTRGGWAALQWNFTGAYGVDAPDAWANLIAAGHPGGAGVTVAVLDTGVAYANHPPFRRSPDLPATRFVRGWDFVDDDPRPDDHNGHGTHVASTIAEATNNGYGLTGLAYGARIMPVRVLDAGGEGDPTTIARGVRFAADHGAKVINLSFNFSPAVGPERIPVLLAAIDHAHARGSLVVAAAGNEHQPVVALPARARYVVGVGATTEDGCAASFSNAGPGLDVVAPGGGRDAALPGDPRCVAARVSRAIYQVTLDRRARGRFTIPRDYVGTSMATPHVAAIAALIVASGVIGADPAPAAIRERLERTARDLGPPGYDTRYGFGLVNAAAATAPGPSSPPIAPASRAAAPRD